MRVIVTGASGFVGSHVLEELLRRGHEVLAVVSGRGKETSSIAGNQSVLVARVDLAEPERTVSVFKGAGSEAVIHLAAKVPSGYPVSPSYFILNNTYATANVLQAAKEAGIPRVVYASSMSVYGATPADSPVSETHSLNPYDHYSLSKAQGEELCRLFASGGKATVLRCAGIFGPGRKGGAVHNFITNAIMGLPSRIERDIAWDIVYVKDVARACADSLRINRPFDTFNIGSGQPTNIVALLEEIYRLVGKEPAFEMSHPDEHSSSYLDISKAKRDLGFEPTARGIALKRTIEWARSHDT